jgi:hypothetical protein
MHTSLSILFALAFSFMVSFPCLAQETKSEAPKPTSPAVETEKKEDRSSEKKTQQFVVRVKTKKKVDFSGTVSHVDPETATLSIRNKGKTISFDMSTPILAGYQSTRDIRRGDTVSVGYTQFGLQIRKGVFSVTHPETAPVAEKTSAPKKTIARAGTAKHRKNGPIWMKEIKNPTSFQDVDNNKDGQITPIELCVMIPGLTMQKFKEYDKNGDGCLNEAEFMAVKRNNR